MAEPGLEKVGSSGSLWAGSPLLVGGLGTSRQEAGDILQIILQ